MTTVRKPLTNGAGIQAWVVGCTSSYVGGTIASRLAEHGIAVCGHHDYERTRPTRMPASAELVVVVHDVCGREASNSAIEQAREAGVPYVVIERKWASARGHLTQAGYPPLAEDQVRPAPAKIRAPVPPSADCVYAAASTPAVEAAPAPPTPAPEAPTMAANTTPSPMKTVPTPPRAAPPAPAPLPTAQNFGDPGAWRDAAFDEALALFRGEMERLGVQSATVTKDRLSTRRVTIIVEESEG